MNTELIKVDAAGKETQVDAFLNMNKIHYVVLGTARIFEMNKDLAGYVTKCPVSSVTEYDIKKYVEGL